MTTFQLTDEQQEIYDKIIRRQNHTSVLMGAAGTGKTTLASKIIEHYTNELSKDSGKFMLVLAPTVTALSNIRKRSISKHGIFKTVAAMLKEPVTYLKIATQEFPISKLEGLLNLKKFLEDKLKINTDDIIDTEDERNVNLLLLEDAIDIRFNGKASLISQFKVSTETRFEDKDPQAIANHLKDIRYIVIDEVTMISDEDMLLLSNAISDYRGPGNKLSVLLCGDPYQLPPVQGEKNGYMNVQKAHKHEDGYYILTQVLRSGDSVIDIATKIKAKVPLELLKKRFTDQFSDVSSLEHLHPTVLSRLTNADIVLAFKNADVTELNKLIRSCKGYSGGVKVGDQLVCLQNELLTPGQTEFFNAEQFIVKSILTGEDAWDRVRANYKLVGITGITCSKLEDYFTKSGRLVLAKLHSTSTGKTKWCIMESLDKFLRVNDKTEISKFLSKRTEEVYQPMYDEMGKAMEKFMLPPLVRMQFGYALTVHKSQGSEWDNVVYYTTKKDQYIIKEPNLNYTAVTRARNDVHILYNDKFV